MGVPAARDLIVDALAQKWSRSRRAVGRVHWPASASAWVYRGKLGASAVRSLMDILGYAPRCGRLYFLCCLEVWLVLILGVSAPRLDTLTSRPERRQGARPGKLQRHTAYRDGRRRALALPIRRCLKGTALRDWARLAQPCDARYAVGGLLTSQGTIYPLLNRLHVGGLVTSHWEVGTGERPRRYYRITDAGRAEAEMFHYDWQHFAHSVTSVLTQLTTSIEGKTQ